MLCQSAATLTGSVGDDARRHGHIVRQLLHHSDYAAIDFVMLKTRSAQLIIFLVDLHFQ